MLKGKYTEYELGETVSASIGKQCELKYTEYELGETVSASIGKQGELKCKD
jgi:hypothetical protein